MGPVAALAVTLLVVESLTLPVFRSGGRTGLTLFQWVKEHSVYGSPIQYVPEEDYARELEGVKIAGLIEAPPAPEDLERVKAYYQISEPSARQLLACEHRMLTAGSAMLKQFFDLKADVRHDGQYHPIRELVQPNDEDVREIARVLIQAEDYVSACQDFVASFTAYHQEIGDFWAMPRETIQAQTLRREQGIEFSCDCDDMSILLCSLLRNYIAPEDVFCAVGEWNGDGHMFVVMPGENGQDRIIESTASSTNPVRGNYKVMALFNDSYCFSYPEGLKEFCLKPVEEKEAVYA